MRTSRSPTTDFPCQPQINPQERVNRETRRRTDVGGTFPDRGSLMWLVAAVPAEQHDEWIEGRRYLGLDVLRRSRNSCGYLRGVFDDITPYFTRSTVSGYTRGIHR